MTDRQMEEVERRLTVWSHESERAENLWSAYSDAHDPKKGEAARRRMVAMDGKLDAVMEILAVMGYAVTWVDGKAKVMEGK